MSAMIIDAARNGLACAIELILCSSPKGVEHIVAAEGYAKRYHHCTLLLYAAQGGHTDVVKVLLTVPNINVNGISGGRYPSPLTPLHCAARDGRCNIVKMILAAPNIHVNAVCFKRKTPLHYASYRGHLDVVKMLVTARDIDVNVFDDDCMTPLHYAFKCDHLDMVKVLLAAPNVDVNVTSLYRMKPLHWVAERGHAEIVKVLLMAPNIEVNAMTAHHQTPLVFAIESGHYDVARILLAAPSIAANFHNNFWHIATLLRAIHAGLTELVNMLFLVPTTGINVNASDKDGVTLLHRGAERGDIDLVKALLALPTIDVNCARAPQFCCTTPLHDAVECGGNNGVGVIGALLASPHINVNARDSKARTPLYRAAELDNVEAVKLLLTMPEIDVGATGHDGATPFDVAKRSSHCKTLRVLSNHLDHHAPRSVVPRHCCDRT